jgi:hypothetical protein
LRVKPLISSGRLELLIKCVTFCCFSDLSACLHEQAMAGLQQPLC